MVGAWKCRAQHVDARAGSRTVVAYCDDGDHLLGQLPRSFIDHRRVAILSQESHKPAGVTFGQMVFLHHLPDRLRQRASVSKTLLRA